MNSQISNCSGGPTVLPCALHISQMVNIPIKQKPIMSQPVHFAETEEFEVIPEPGISANLRELRQGWMGKRKFVAPSFAEMMLDMKKLEATLEAIEKGCEFVLPAEQRPAAQEWQPEPFDPDRTSVISVDEFRQTEFYLYAPMAESVQLIADFTHWRKFPLDMVKSEGGTWCIVIPLPPGQYDYAFVVDGQWQNDSQLRSILVGAPQESGRRAAA
jgi:hypothetical protein